MPARLAFATLTPKQKATSAPTAVAQNTALVKAQKGSIVMNRTRAAAGVSIILCVGVLLGLLTGCLYLSGPAPIEMIKLIIGISLALIATLYIYWVEGLPAKTQEPIQ